jgi:ketosteroid isomerase-like protein
MTPMEIMDRLATTWSPLAMTDPTTTERQLDVFADDLVVIEPDSLPQGGRHCGADEFRKLQMCMRELWEQRIEGSEYWQAAEDLVVLRIVIRWTARSTGRSAVVPMIDMLRFREGKIVEVEAWVRDTKVLLDTLEPISLPPGC